MNVYVITCNDSVERVVRGSEEFAEQQMNKLRNAYYERTKGSWTLSVVTESYKADRDAYALRCHWAIRSTPFVDQS